jgi:hypothetical protein
MEKVMADSATVHIGENSAEQVAYKLFYDVMNAEKKSLSNVDRAYILKTYWECRRVVAGLKVPEN